jgi:hypothetical protein
MSSSLDTLAICAVAVVVESLNWSWTVPVGTPGSWKLPDVSTGVDMLVPATDTFIPAGAEAPALRTVPAMVAAPAPPAEGPVGELLPPQAIAAAIVRLTIVSKTVFRVDMGSKAPWV